MPFKTLLLGLLAICQTTTAHFSLDYPSWRADTLSEEGERLYSQWNYPCAGVNFTNTPTDWPLTGGSLRLSLHHPWSYLFINLGLGADAPNFNISLTPSLWNVTGKGSLCIDELRLPQPIADGTVGSLQVVTAGASGAALYNCADVRFSKDARRLDNCTSDDGIVIHAVQEQDGDEKASGGGNSGGNSTGGSGGRGQSGGGGATSVAAGYVSPNRLAVASALGLAVAFAFELGM
ncbi:Uncharacterized protein ESCO_002429 [Escovopsis weberi]|uniref:Copper acquisition factor BIM1-like domain-containing protein n=1 Tax=Escovopsis weberi TaxID=150374 RepID=A0A0M8N1K6_ESCWE|nr:Uncharacterized protein ESCO_002429 [Escovopsis weberi]